MTISLFIFLVHGVYSTRNVSHLLYFIGCMHFSLGIRDSRPLFARNQGDAGIVSCAEIDGGASRHRAFSHHCANLLATDPEVMQQLLQSQSTAYRLLGKLCYAV